MLASRSLRFLASYCRPAPLYTWSIKTRAPMAVNTTTTWYIRPPTMIASYSKDSKNAFISSSINQNRLNSNTVPQTETITTPTLSTSPSSPSIKSSAIASETSSIKNPPTFSSEPLTKASPNSSIQSSEICKNPSQFTDNCSKTTPDSPIQPPNIKLPSRDQVEKYFFTALVYIWDFCYYVFCLTLRIIDKYVLKNPTLQENWKKLVKRLDEQRQAINSKK